MARRHVERCASSVVGAALVEVEEAEGVLGRGWGVVEEC